MSGYEKLFEAINYYLEEETEKVAIALADVDANDLELEEAKSILAFLKSEALGVDSQALFEKGRDTYNNGKDDEALEFLEQALELDERNAAALYFMGRVNQRKG